MTCIGCDLRKAFEVDVSNANLHLTLLCSYLLFRKIKESDVALHSFYPPLTSTQFGRLSVVALLRIDMKSSEAVESKEFEEVVSTDVKPARTSPNSMTVPSDGRFQEAKPTPRSYIAISPPFLPTYPITLASVPPLHEVPTTRTKTKTARPLCHHARYVLEEKPKRSPTANDNMECTNCGTKNTSAWRRSAEGKSECNACNLFFRKNGRKRPASMRRDTIARRYRLSRCDLCALEAQGGGHGNTSQIQKTRARRNGRAKVSETAGEIPRTGQLCAPPGPQGAGPHQYFVSHAGFQQPLQTFLPTSVSYVHQNPVMMSYATERTVFNVMNMEQQMGATPPDSHFCFVRDANNVVASPASQSLTTTEPPLGIAKHEGADGKFGVVAENIEVSQRETQEQYQQFEQQRQKYAGYATKRKAVDDQLRSEFSETINAAKGEDIVDDYVNASAVTPLLREGSVKNSKRHDLDSSFEIFKEKCRGHDDNELVFRSL
ncbi:hypothetical protein RB195_010186 [Necator americanus]|uniref:GATA-type domain-containing protein n=1 Tax=Necator americanus TaxID=51031 RepID=A0ABR1CWU7_NECAM